MGKIVVLVGGVASGKTTIAKRLEEQGFKRIVTYTTRPKRANEVDGVDYHFVSKREFATLNNNDFFAETTRYKTALGEWYYGSSRPSYSDSEDQVVVLNPNGVLELLVPAFIVWLDQPRKVAMQRALDRGDDPLEICRRMLADADDFTAFSLSGKWDLCINADEDDIVDNVVYNILKNLRESKNADKAKEERV
jgi:guanylate kinase